MASGVLGTLVLGLALSSLALVRCFRLLAALTAAQLSWLRIAARWPALITARTFYPPLDARAPKLRRSAWLMLSAPHASIPLWPQLRAGELLSDDQLWLRVLVSMAGALLVVAVGGAAVALAIFLVGVPRLPDGVIAINGVDLSGAFSALDQLTITRLHRARPASVSGYETRLTVLVALYAASIVLDLGILARELGVVARHRAAFLARLGAAGQEAAWLDYRRFRGLRGLSERQIVDLFASHGLGASADGPIGMREVVVVPDTSSLRALATEQERALDALEVAETAYIASFECADQDAIVQSEAEPKRRRHSTKPSPDQAVAVIGAHGPRGAYTLSSAWPDRVRKASISLSEAIGRRRNQPGGGNDTGTFTEAMDRRSTAMALTNFPIGSTVSVNRHGAYERVDSPLDTIVTPRMPTASLRLADHSTAPTTPIRTGDDDGEDSMSTAPTIPSVITVTPDKQSPTPTVTPIEYATRQSPSAPITLQPAPSGRPTRARSSSLESEGELVTTPCDAYHPLVRPSSVIGDQPERVRQLYDDIRSHRSALRRITHDFETARSALVAEPGSSALGCLIVGRGVQLIPGAEPIEGSTRDDVRWSTLGRRGLGSVGFAVALIAIGLALAAAMVPIFAGAMIQYPGTVSYLPFLRPVLDRGGLALGLFTSSAPAIASLLVLVIAMVLLRVAIRSVTVASHHSARRQLLFSLAVIILIPVVAFGIVMAALTVSAQARDLGARDRGSQLADAAAASSLLYLNLGVLLALVIVPMLLLGPWSLIAGLRRLDRASTPRRLFTALQPQSLDRGLSFAVAFLALVLGLVFAPIAPLVVRSRALAVLIAQTFVMLTCAALLAWTTRLPVAQSYVRRTCSGGLLELDALRLSLFAVALSPLLLALSMFSREHWGRASTLLGLSLLGVIGSAILSLRAVVRHRLDAATHAAVEALYRAATDRAFEPARRRGGIGGSSASRRSWASVLDIVQLLGPTPAQSSYGIAWPSESGGAETDAPVVETEWIDPLRRSQADVAARAHPDAPPYLPPVLEDRTEDVGRWLDPILARGPPHVWLPNDPLSAEEADDLSRLWGLASVRWTDAVALDKLRLRTRR